MSLLVQRLLHALSSALVPIKTGHLKACHCNCYFKLKTRLTLLLNQYIPRCPYYTTFYAFRRTGVHPPFTIISK